MSDSPGLVDFAIGLVYSALNLPAGQVTFFDKFKLNKNCVINPRHQNDFEASWYDFWASTCQVQLAWNYGCKTDFLCNLSGTCKLAKWYEAKPSKKVGSQLSNEKQKQPFIHYVDFILP